MSAQGLGSLPPDITSAIFDLCCLKDKAALAVTCKDLRALAPRFLSCTVARSIFQMMRATCTEIAAGNNMPYTRTEFGHIYSSVHARVAKTKIIESLYVVVWDGKAKLYVSFRARKMLACDDLASSMRQTHLFSWVWNPAAPRVCPDTHAARSLHATAKAALEAYCGGPISSSMRCLTKY